MDNPKCPICGEEMTLMDEIEGETYTDSIYQCDNVLCERFGVQDTHRE